jgi:hypothetical protein
MLYYNTVSNIMRIYSGSAWENVAVSTAGFSPKINEDVVVTSTATELNLLDGVSGLVQADFTKLAAIDSTATELNKLDGLSRGSIIYGNASAATTVLTKGTANQVLTSDGTDISWSDPASGGTDWQSTIVTGSTLTAVANEGYWIDTTSNACTITLPGSASVGDQLVFVDFLRTWGTNAITIDQNSLNFQGYSSPNPVYDTNGQSVSIVYSGATQGWIPTVDDDVTNETLQPTTVDFLVLAGGASGGRSTSGGGGGAGGYRTSTQSVPSGTVITVTVGDGGASVTGTNANGNNGSDSSISGSGLTTITSTGGGGGGSVTNGNNGGSGGGAGDTTPSYQGGLGNSPSTSPSQGNNGGTKSSAPYNSQAASGGGGAGAVGGNGIYSPEAAGNGGEGTVSSITGSSVTRAGGGGGGVYNGTQSTGGAGGGGAGGKSSPAISGASATVNTGGGGGGGEGTSGAGGKGVVILSMLDADYSTTTTGSPTVATGVCRKNSFNIYRIRELHNIMASFAKIGLNNKVIEVLSVKNEVLNDANG